MGEKVGERRGSFRVPMAGNICWRSDTLCLAARGATRERQRPPGLVAEPWCTSSIKRFHHTVHLLSARARMTAPLSPRPPDAFLFSPSRIGGLRAVGRQPIIL